MSDLFLKEKKIECLKMFNDLLQKKQKVTFSNNLIIK